MAARMHTHGYDFYAPTRAIVFHLWDRGYRPTFREVKGREADRANGEHRVAEILHKCSGRSASTSMDTPVHNIHGDGKLLENVNSDHSCRLGVPMWGQLRTAQSHSELCGVDFAAGQLLPGVEELPRYGGQHPQVFVPDDSQICGTANLFAN